MSATGRFAARITFLTLFALGFSPLAQAQGSSQIVDNADLMQAQQRGAIIWDVRAEAAYNKGHIPGAINIGQVATSLRDAATEDFLPTAQLEKILGQAGIDPAREIIAYATRGNPNAYFAQYTMEYFGGNRVKVLHDGIDGWRAAGRPVSTEPTRLKPVALKLHARAANFISTRDVIARLNNPGVQLLDVRTPGEFSGEDVRASRGGHIPGALNIPYEQNWVDPQTPAKLSSGQASDNVGMSLKPAALLKALYAKLDPNRETVVYCQSGVRAAETAAVLKDLGFKNVKVYDSSWLGYSSTPDAPAQ